MVVAYTPLHTAKQYFGPARVVGKWTHTCVFWLKSCMWVSIAVKAWILSLSLSLLQLFSLFSLLCLSLSPYCDVLHEYRYKWLPTFIYSLMCRIEAEQRDDDALEGKKKDRLSWHQKKALKKKEPEESLRASNAKSLGNKTKR